MEFDRSFITALFVYFAACAFLSHYKHPKMFDKQGNFKCFGLHADETVFPYWLVTLVIGLSTYYGMVLQARA